MLAKGSVKGCHAGVIGVSFFIQGGTCAITHSIVIVGINASENIRIVIFPEIVVALTKELVGRHYSHFIGNILTVVSYTYPRDIGGKVACLLVQRIAVVPAFAHLVEHGHIQLALRLGVHSLTEQVPTWLIGLRIYHESEQPVVRTGSR